MAVALFDNKNKTEKTVTTMTEGMTSEKMSLHILHTISFNIILF